MQPVKQKDARPALAGLLARRFGCMVGAQWGSGLLAGFFVILLARNGPEAFGLVTLALALGELTTMLTDAGFESYLVPRFTAERARPRRILAQTLLLQSLLVLFSLGLLAALCPILGYDADKSAIILLVASGMGPGALARSFFTLCRVRGRQDTEMRIRVPAGLAGSAFGIICLLLGAPLPLVACFKLAETLVLFILIGLSLRWRLGGFPSGIRQWAGRYRGAFLFAGIAVCGLVYNKLNIYVLDQYGGAYALGLYNAPWEIIDGLSVLVSGALIERVMFPLMAAQWLNDRPAFVRMTRTAAISLLLLGISIAYALFVEGDRILRLAFGAEYLAAAEPLRVQILCIPASFLHNLAACMLISMRLHHPVLLIYVSGLICNLLLCWGFIPEQGVLGAAIAISGTKLWMVMLTMGLAMRLGLAFHPAELGAAVLAAALAFGGHALCLPHLPREAAELLGFAPLLLAGCWLLPRMRDRADRRNLDSVYLQK